MIDLTGSGPRDGREPTHHARPAPLPAPDALYRSLVDDAQELVVAIDDEFRFAFVGGAAEALTGQAPQALVGRSVGDFVHPEDLERAVKHVIGWEAYGPPRGSSGFRVRHADGSWVPIDVTAAEVADGDRRYLAVYGRPIDHQHAAEQILATLLESGDQASALRPVLDLFSWEANDARVAICWTDADGRRSQVSTGLAPVLAGVDLPSGPDPWGAAMASGRELLVTDVGELPPAVAAAARAAGRAAAWIVPVAPEGGPAAAITVWSGVGRGRPDGHAYGMELATTYVELIVRWSSHVSRLTDAATLDPLTEVGNRTALFQALEGDQDGGALLFCDLDHFKPVNDRHGHVAGDAVLREVASRIAGCVRGSDLVARTGGDEFVVLARGATTEQAASLAARIRDAVTEPIALGDATVVVGVTIGVAHTVEPLSEATLAGADAALVTAKADDRGSVRWAQATSERPLTSTE